MGRYTTEDFKKIMKKAHPHVEVLSEWVDSKTKIKCHCTLDDFIWEVYPRTAREKGCPKCNNSITRKWTDEEFEEVENLEESNRGEDGHGSTGK